MIYNDESGGSYRAHIKANWVLRLMHELCKCPHWCQNSTRLHSLVISLNWYEYTLTVLDQFGSIDSAFPTLPQIRSRKQFKTGSIVVVALPYGELIPSIIGEVRL